MRQIGESCQQFDAVKVTCHGTSGPSCEGVDHFSDLSKTHLMGYVAGELAAHGRWTPGCFTDDLGRQCAAGVGKLGKNCAVFRVDRLGQRLVTRDDRVVQTNQCRR